MALPAAAAAAAHLLALVADPLQHRRRLTHGRECLPGAIHAFRFAAGRIPEEVLRAVPTATRDNLAEAARFFIREVCLWEGATHYQVLGVPSDARPAAIKEHYHALMGLFHPDRQARSAVRWPESAAPRVNAAWAVLSDAAQRRDYDATLPRGEPAMAEPRVDRGRGEWLPRRPAAGRALPWRPRHARAALLGTAAIATLAFAYASFSTDVPDEYALLQGRWIPEVSPRIRPKFLGLEAPPSPVAVSIAGDIPMHAPDAAPPPEVAARPAALVKPAEARPQPAPPKPGTVASEAARSVAGAQVAQAAPAVQLAQAASPAAAAPPVPEAMVPDLDVLVAQVVTYYEGGNVEGLVGLFDASRIGTLESAGLRHDYEAFFAATRARQLQVRSLAWEASGGNGARARGEALVRTTYPDASQGTVERVVKLDMAIVMRSGRPRLVQLSLYPHD